MPSNGDISIFHRFLCSNPENEDKNWSKLRKNLADNQWLYIHRYRTPHQWPTRRAFLLNMILVGLGIRTRTTLISEVSYSPK